MHKAGCKEGVVSLFADVLKGTHGVLMDMFEEARLSRAGVVVECAAGAAYCEEGVWKDGRGAREMVCAVVPAGGVDEAVEAGTVTGEDRMIDSGSGRQGMEEASWYLGETLVVL